MRLNYSFWTEKGLVTQKIDLGTHIQSLEHVLLT